MTPADISARGLVLSLLSSVGADRQPVARLIHAAALFGIEPPALRVAITRMQKMDLLASPERGIYTAGPRARALTRRVQQWEEVASKTTRWNGDWLIALTHHLGRTDRKQLRARERALALSGYRESDSAVWVRPANLARGLPDHRRDLVAIGADPGISLVQASTTASSDDNNWAGLWSPHQLEQSYTRALREMSASLARLDGLDADAAARETLLIGQAVIRTINFDPLLPSELSNEALFLEMVEAMKRYNKTGRACWEAYFEQLGTDAGG